MRLSIIVPIYNEENTVQKIVQKMENLKIDKIQKEIIW